MKISRRSDPISRFHRSGIELHSFRQFTIGYNRIIMWANILDSIISSFFLNDLLAGSEDLVEKPSEFRFEESTNRMKTRVQLFHRYPHQSQIAFVWVGGSGIYTGRVLNPTFHWLFRHGYLDITNITVFYKYWRKTHIW